MSVLIQREPVVNRHKTITASRLRVRAASCGEAAVELNRLADTWPVARNVLVGLVGCELNEDILTWRPPQNVMVEIPAARLPDPAVRQIIDALVARQVPLCLDSYTPGMDIPAAANFRFLLADAATPMQNAPALLLAKGLTTQEEFDAAVADGFAGATGWFFRRAAAPFGDKMNPGHLQIVRLLNLVRNNAEIKEIEIELKQDVTLAFKLLRYINSAGFGAGGDVGSFRHAVTLMGYNKLNRWLSLLLVNASQDPIAPALMQTAVIRGRFMELASAGILPKERQDDLFITGAFSVLDMLLGSRMDVVLQHLQLPVEIANALLGKDSPLSAMMKLALTLEGGKPEELAAQLGGLGLSVEQCNRAQIEALAFADKLQFN